MEKKRKLKISVKIILIILLIIILTCLLKLPLFIKLNGDASLTIEVNESYQELGAKQSFNQDVTIEGNVDTSKVGKYVITYKWLTQSIKRTVNVVDTTPPEIKLNGYEKVIIISQDEYVDAGYEVKDNYDNEVDVEVIYNEEFSDGFEINYIAKDSSGNTSKVVRRIYVVDDDYQYQNLVTNDQNVDSKYLDTIIDLTNNYYANMKYLKYIDCSNLFSNQEQYYLYKAINQMMIKTRLNNRLNLAFKDINYDIEVIDYQKTNSGCTIETLEEVNITYLFDDSFTSSAQLSCIYQLNQSGKIINYERIEGMFYHLFGSYKSQNNYQEYIDNKIEEYYLKWLDSYKEYMQQLDDVNNGLINMDNTITLQANYGYDRKKAKDYALKYCFSRNPEYFYIEGNNCVNFSCQCLHEGGLPMIDVGNNQWKNYSFVPNTSDEKKGFTYSWTGTGYFIDFIESSDKIVIQSNVTPYLAQEGDIIMFGSSHKGVGHAVVVTDIIKDQNGKVIDILYCGNTNNTKNMPLSVSQHTYFELEKVIGYN